MKNKLIYILLVLILSFWAVKPFLSSGFFPMHDDTQPARVEEMAKALSYGQFPVRWVPDLGYGYGYPLFNFYAPLPYYIGGFFRLAGLDAIIATKVMFIIGVLLSGITMYLLVESFVGSISGVVAAVLYVYAPYHAVNIYVRGAVGEFYAYAFLPLLLLGVYIIIKSGRKLKEGILIGALGLAGVLLSHNILGMLALYLFIIGIITYLIYTLIRKQSLFIIYRLSFILLFGIGLSAFFTIPAVLEKQYTKVEELTAGQNNFQNHFVYPDQLWQSDWGYAGSAPGRADGMSFKIGKFHLLLGLVALIYLTALFKKKKIDSFQLLTCLLYLLLFTVSIILMLPLSETAWKILPGFSYIQYPWRFLNFTLLSLTFFSSAIFLKLNKLISLIIGVLIIIVAIWWNVKYFQPQLYLPFRQEDYISPENLTYKISRISDEYLPDKFLIPRAKSEVATNVIVETEGMKLKILKSTPVEKIYFIDMPETTDLTVNLANFPGWMVRVDGVKTEIHDTFGRIGLVIPQGQHILSFNFTNTVVRSLSNVISILSLFLLVYVSLFQVKNQLWPRRKRVSR